jgi:hypothetical protein
MKRLNILFASWLFLKNYEDYENNIFSGFTTIDPVCLWAGGYTETIPMGKPIGSAFWFYIGIFS